MNVQLPIFEGPLDLLLYLITKNEIDIFDIPISQITHEYLEYIEKMRALQIEPASEFLLMAARLINIKSSMLLMDKNETKEDPRQELVEELLYYQFFKEVGESLLKREVLYRDVFPRPLPKRKDFEDEEYIVNLSVADLFQAMKEVISKSNADEITEIEKEKVSVAEMAKFIVNHLETNKKTTFKELIGMFPGLAYAIAAFLAVLELIRWGLIRAFQKHLFGEIFLEKTDIPFSPETFEEIEEYGEKRTEENY